MSTASEPKTFGVKEFTRPASDVDRAVEEITVLGYTLLPGVLTASELELAREKMDAVYQTQLEEIGGAAQLEAIGDAHTAMCLLGYDDFFLTIAANARVLAIVQRFLGEYFTLMLQNGIFNVPEVGDANNPGYWHRDLGYQHFVSSRPLGITALYCIDEFTELTGGTYVLPGSHKVEPFPSDHFVLRHQTGITAPAGSVIVFDSMLYHRGGHNRSGAVRRGVNNIYTLPLLRQQLDLPKMLGGRHADDPLLRKLLGYDIESDADVTSFRRRRLARGNVTDTPRR